MASLFEQVSSFFGFEIKRPAQEKQEEVPSFAPRIEDDGAAIVSSGGFYGQYIDLEGTVKTESELINRYRDMSLIPEVDSAIDDIVNEAIITEDGEKTISLVLDDLEEGVMPDTLKIAIEKEFDTVLRLFEFNTKSYDIFRRWYVDGRLYYHVMVDKNNEQEGIQELRFLDPRKIKKVREVAKGRNKDMPNLPTQKTVKEYYVYTERDVSSGPRNSLAAPATPSAGIKIAKDSVIQTTSGITDTYDKMIIGYLHKAIKPLNQLRALEDATIIYRISRAPERRVFYIDVGNLPKIKAEQYVRDMMNKHRNKLVYDSTSGEIKDDRKFMTMLEDYWMPRREGGKGTEITTLPAGQNLGELADVEYFQRKLYKALNVPTGRLEADATFNFGRQAEITRDEVKFAKFIDRLRLRFSLILLKALEKQLILKGICTPDEWREWEGDIKFRYLRDNRFAELKDQDTWMGRLNVAQLFVPWIGKYVSHNWVRKNIFKQTDEDIELLDAEILEETTLPQYKMMDMMGGMGMGMMGGGMDMGGGGPPPPDQGPPNGNGKAPPPKFAGSSFGPSYGGLNEEVEPEEQPKSVININKFHQ